MCQFFDAYVKATSTGPQFKKKEELQKLCIFETRDCKRCG